MGAPRLARQLAFGRGQLGSLGRSRGGVKGNSCESHFPTYAQSRLPAFPLLSPPPLLRHFYSRRAWRIPHMDILGCLQMALRFSLAWCASLLKISPHLQRCSSRSRETLAFTIYRLRFRRDPGASGGVTRGNDKLPSSVKSCVTCGTLRC